MKAAVAAITFIGAPLLAGAVGALGSLSAATFYAQILKPRWAPPASLFGPVWTVLYLLMGIAAFLVWRSAGWTGARSALALFLGHLIVNAAWSWLFFRWHLGMASLACIALLWVMVIAIVVLFSHLRTVAAWLLLPYLLWVSFATMLNFAVVRLNPGLLR